MRAFRIVEDSEDRKVLFESTKPSEICESWETLSADHDLEIESSDGWGCYISSSRKIIKQVGGVDGVSITYGDSGSSMDAADVPMLPWIGLQQAKDSLPWLMQSALAQIPSPRERGRQEQEVIIIEDEFDYGEYSLQSPGYCKAYYLGKDLVRFEGETCGGHTYRIEAYRDAVSVKGDFLGQTFWKSLLAAFRASMPWEVKLYLELTGAQERILRQAREITSNLGEQNRKEKMND